MRLWVDQVIGRAAVQGSPGFSDLRWPAPVFPGDALSAHAEVLSARLSRSRAGLGLVGLRASMSRGDTTVMWSDSIVMINTR